MTELLSPCLIRHLLYSFWLIFFSVYSAVFVFRCCRLTYLWVSWSRFMFAPVRHSFASLIYKQLSKKATLMFQDVLLFELFQRTYLIPFYFHINQLRNFPAKTYGSVKKRIAQRTEGNTQYAFSWTSRQPISVRHELKTSSVI